MATVILVRHGRTTANASGLLAGRTPGVRLDERGQEQADAAGLRLAGLNVARWVTSPQERCGQTLERLIAPLAERPEFEVEQGIAECDYGTWQNRPISELAAEPMWKTVQAQPSAASFPGGESMAQMSARAVAAIRRIDAEVNASHGTDAVWVAVSHGDPIKAILADALGMHLDLFQRLHVDPAAVSIIRYTEARPFVLGTNTHSSDLRWLQGSKVTGVSHDAVIGGGAGPDAPENGDASSQKTSPSEPSERAPQHG